MPSSTASRRWVVNASPLILLSKIGKAELLAALATELVIPQRSGANSKADLMAIRRAESPMP